MLSRFLASNCSFTKPCCSLGPCAYRRLRSLTLRFNHHMPFPTLRTSPTVQTQSYFGITRGHIHHIDNGFGFTDRFPYRSVGRDAKKLITVSAPCAQALNIALLALTGGQLPSRALLVRGVLVFTPAIDFCSDSMPSLPPKRTHTHTHTQISLPFHAQFLTTHTHTHTFPISRTPVEGLYSASAGTHPAGSVLGAAGHNCAAALVRDFGLKPLWATA
jgi:hypothetical protein